MIPHTPFPRLHFLHRITSGGEGRAVCHDGGRPCGEPPGTPEGDSRPARAAVDCQPAAQGEISFASDVSVWLLARWLSEPALALVVYGDLT